jgi:hypothetical protein
MGRKKYTAEIYNQERMKRVRFNHIEIRNSNVYKGEVSKNKIK